jgi:ferredoxin-thioredoxin reductase catalytic subunit
MIKIGSLSLNYKGAGGRFILCHRASGVEFVGKLIACPCAGSSVAFNIRGSSICLCSTYKTGKSYVKNNVELTRLRGQLAFADYCRSCALKLDSYRRPTIRFLPRYDV